MPRRTKCILGIMGRVYDCLRDAPISTADGSVCRTFSRLLDKADGYGSDCACFGGVFTVREKGNL